MVKEVNDCSCDRKCRAVDLAVRTPDALVLTLLDIASHLLKNGELISHAADLTPQQWLVLLQIAGDPNFPGSSGRDRSRHVLASEIAEDRSVSRANISVLVSSLVKAGLVRQTDDPQDRRRKRLQITAKGRGAIDCIQVARQEANENLVEGLSSTSQQRLLRTLNRILARAQNASDGVACKTTRVDA